MKRILVIEREYGAGGSVIAEKAAQRLGWKLLDNALTERIAQLAKVSPEVCKHREERVDPWLYRLAKVFWRGSHERSVGLPECRHRRCRPLDLPQSKGHRGGGQGRANA